MEGADRVLAMTVGTAGLARREGALFAPLRKSVATNAWSRVVPPPSGVTHDPTQELRAGLPVGWHDPGKKPKQREKQVRKKREAITRIRRGGGDAPAD